MMNGVLKWFVVRGRAGWSVWKTGPFTFNTRTRELAVGDGRARLLPGDMPKFLLAVGALGQHEEASYLSGTWRSTMSSASKSLASDTAPSVLVKPRPGLSRGYGDGFVDC